MSVEQKDCSKILVKTCQVLPEGPTKGQRGRLFGIVKDVKKRVGDELFEALTLRYYPLLSSIQGFSPEAFINGLRTEGSQQLLQKFEIDLLEFCKKHDLSEDQIPELVRMHYRVKEDIRSYAASQSRFRKTSGHKHIEPNIKRYEAQKPLGAREVGPLLIQFYNSIVALAEEDKRKEPIIFSTREQISKALGSSTFRLITKSESYRPTNTKPMLRSTAAVAQLEGLREKLIQIQSQRILGDSTGESMRKYATARQRYDYPSNPAHKEIGDLVTATQRSIADPYRIIY